MAHGHVCRDVVLVNQTGSTAATLVCKVSNMRSAVYFRPRFAFDYAPDYLPPESRAAAAAFAAQGGGISVADDPSPWLAPTLGPKYDSYGLGRVLAETALGRPLKPVHSTSAPTADDAHPWRAAPGWAALPAELRGVVAALCAADPAGRASVADALRMPFATMQLEGEEDCGEGASRLASTDGDDVKALLAALKAIAPTGGQDTPTAPAPATPALTAAARAAVNSSEDGGSGRGGSQQQQREPEIQPASPRAGAINHHRLQQQQSAPKTTFVISRAEEQQPEKGGLMKRGLHRCAKRLREFGAAVKGCFGGGMPLPTDD